VLVEVQTARTHLGQFDRAIQRLLRRIPVFLLWLLGMRLFGGRLAIINWFEQVWKRSHGIPGWSYTSLGCGRTLRG
jgi:hypothetical protein